MELLREPWRIHLSQFWILILSEACLQTVSPGMLNASSSLLRQHHSPAEADNFPHCLSEREIKICPCLFKTRSPTIWGLDMSPSLPVI